MKTQKTIKKLRFSKETVANLNTNEMRFIYGGGLDQGQAIAIELTESCYQCIGHDEQPYETYSHCAGSSC
jgi:natural product precursor